MNLEIAKVIMAMIALILVFSIFFYKSDTKKESRKYKNEESEVLVNNEYINDVNIDDVLLFDYANLYYQDYFYESDHVLILNYKETCEELGDEYSIKVFDQNNIELTTQFIADRTEYIEGDDLYYTNYHLQINLSDNVNCFKIVVLRDDAEYSVSCSMEDFIK